MKKLMLGLLACTGIMFGAQPTMFETVKAKAASMIPQTQKDQFKKLFANPAELCGNVVINAGLYVGVPYGITYGLENTVRGKQLKDAVFFEQEYTTVKYGLYSLSALAAVKKFVVGGRITESAYNKVLLAGASGLVLSKLIATAWNRYVLATETKSMVEKATTKVNEVLKGSSDSSSDTSTKGLNMPYGFGCMMLALACSNILG